MGKRTKKLIVLITLMAMLDFSLVTKYSLASNDANDIKDDIEKYQNKKEDTQKQLNTSVAQLQQTKAAINVTQNLLQKTKSDISRKEAELDNLEQKMELNKKILSAYIQEMYYDDEDPLANLILADKNIDQLSTNFDQMISVKQKVLETIDEINQTKDDISQTKEELANKKEDHEKLLSIQQGQQYEINGDIQEAQATLSELNAKIDKLKGELSRLLGSSVSFKNVMDAAAFAAKATGIRKDYLLGVLVQESNLGRFTGGCTADKSNMNSYRLGLFKNICSDLDYNWKKQKVSCPPKGYVGTGGAMGVAQFMSDTWMSYKSSIASVTGHNPPDPWDLTDGVVAMALKLTKVDGVKQHKKSAEAKAYCVYLAGGNWQSYCDSKGVNYGEKVLYWADNYEKVMD